MTSTIFVFNVSYENEIPFVPYFLKYTTEYICNNVFYISNYSLYVL